MAADDFADFLKRVRAGDEQAAAELVKRYEKAIQREIRLRLTDPAVGRVLSEEDVCQSVLASFFVRSALGQYDLNDPAQMLQLLLSMARNKIAAAARRQTAQKRGGGARPAEADDQLALASAATASRIVAGREILELMRGQMTAEERQVAELRAAGHEWPEIASRLGGTPDGRRMQLTRALDRIGPVLGLEDAEG